MSIINAKVVGFGISYKTYSTQMVGVSRGHREFSMSRGELVNFATNPKRWIDGFQANEDPTKATAWGSLIDTMALTPERLDDQYAVSPPTYPAKGMECPKCHSVTDSKSCRACKCDRVETTIEKEWNGTAEFCKEWIKKQGEKEIIKSEVMDEAKTAVSILEEEMSGLLTVSKRQCFCVSEWQDKETGLAIPIRCLIDLVPDKDDSVYGKALANLKTARDGDPDIWPRVVDANGYDVSSALEMDIYTAATGEERCDFILPIQENVKPYHVVKPFVALTAEFIEYGRVKYKIALREYAQCLATNHWPSYPTGDRLVYGNLQFLDPKSLFKYRETGGVVC